MCEVLTEGRKQTVLLLIRVSQVGTLSLQDSALKLDLPADVINEIAQSPYADKTLRKMIVDLGTLENVQSWNSSVLSSSFGAITFNQILNLIRENVSNFEALENFFLKVSCGSYTLNDLANCSLQ